MTAEHVDRKQLKADTKELFRTAQVSPKGMAALYLGLGMLLNLVDSFANRGSDGFPSPLGLFVTILTAFLSTVLGAGFILYCMAIRRGERAEYGTLFDGFAFVGRIIALELVMSLFVLLWSMLFIVPGIVAAYRYRFAMYNLCENPGVGVMEALDMSKRQTLGYKGQLFVLDWSYFGWQVLCIFPTLIILGCFIGAAIQVDNYAPWDLVLYFQQLFFWTVLAAVWAFVTALFYRPNYQCVELGYFETAKRTSGVGLCQEPPRLEEDSDSGWGQM